MLIRPIAKEIQGPKRLLIIPSGLLYYLPLQPSHDAAELRLLPYDAGV